MFLARTGHGGSVTSAPHPPMASPPSPDLLLVGKQRLEGLQGLLFGEAVLRRLALEESELTALVVDGRPLPIVPGDEVGIVLRPLRVLGRGAVDVAIADTR